MENGVEYEVIEHKAEKEKDVNYFVVKAVEFVQPAYVTALCSVDVEVGKKITVVNGKMLSDGKEVGEVKKSFSGKDIRITHEYDIKYTGGYSRDGKTIYMSKEFPQFIEVNGKKVDALETIGRHHELTEKWLSDDAYEYPYAHEVATKIERLYVESLGVEWNAYCTEVDKNLRHVYAQKLQKSPKSLDLAPYIYGRDQEALKEIRDSMEL